MPAGVHTHPLQMEVLCRNGMLEQPSLQWLQHNKEER